jgi:hypothetical protein
MLISAQVERATSCHKMLVLLLESYPYEPLEARAIRCLLGCYIGGYLPMVELVLTTHHFLILA